MAAAYSPFLMNALARYGGAMPGGVMPAWGGRPPIARAPIALPAGTQNTLGGYAGPPRFEGGPVQAPLQGTGVPIKGTAMRPPMRMPTATFPSGGMNSLRGYSNL